MTDALPSGKTNGRSANAGTAPVPQVTLSFRPEGGGLRVSFSGSLTAHTLPVADKQLRQGLGKTAGSVVFDLQALSLLDTSGALFLTLAVARLREGNVRCGFADLTEQQDGLLKKSVLPQRKDSASDARQALLTHFLATLGKAMCEAGSLVVGLIGLFGCFLAALLRHPLRMRWTPLIFQMEQVGLRAVPIVSLLTFLIGLVVAYMGAQQLSLFGADIFAVNLLEVTVLREMAVLITSIVVAGRSSSAFAAQIGAMVANEEVDALRSMGLDPLPLLVVPRVLALVLTLPMLVFVADVMALFGGAVAISLTIDLSFNAFLTQFISVANINNFLVGLIKTPFFAMSIGLVGCFQGFRATGSAESVGFLTTISVVQSIFVVILLDALFAIFFSNIGM